MMMRRVLLLFALVYVLVPSSSVHAAETADAGDRVVSATEAFRSAMSEEGTEARARAFRQAAQLYDAALDSGLSNGALEFNAANSWFLAGDLGRAVLHYRRALLVRPGDPRVLANLDTARARRTDDIEETSGRAVAETVFFWHRGLSLRSKVPLTLAAWVLGFGLLAAGAWWSRRRLSRTGVIVLVIALALGVSTGAELQERAERDAAVVTADEVALRTGDGSSYPARYENPVHSGTELRIAEERAGWVDVELPDGKRGWVPADAVERV